MSHKQMAPSTLQVLTVLESSMFSPDIALELEWAKCLTGANGFVFKSQRRTDPSLAPDPQETQFG